MDMNEATGQPVAFLIDRTKGDPLSICIQVEDMTIAYEDKPVLWDCDVDIPRGSITAIVGPNGAGKSTLLKGILGLLPTISGSVSIDGKPFKGEAHRIAYIPQRSAVNWSFPTTVYDVVLMGRYVHLGWFRRPSKEDKRIAEEAMERMGLTEFRHRQISQLSGGQKQRVFIARAIAQQADIYFMDEPLAGVDTVTEDIIFSFLKECQREGKTSVVVHHDLKTLQNHFDFMVLLNRRVMAEGPVQDVLAQGLLEKTFGGDVHV